MITTNEETAYDPYIKDAVGLMASGYRLFGSLTNADMELISELANLIVTVKVKSDKEFMQLIGE